MKIDVHALSGEPPVTCAAIEGRIDAYTVDRVEEELNSLIRIGSFHLVCDLSGVEFVTGSGFKAFRRIATLAREQGGDVKFCGLRADVGRLFRSVGFDGEVSVWDSREEALSDFVSPGRSGGPSPSGAGRSKFGGLGAEVARLFQSVGIARKAGESAEEESASTTPPTQLLSPGSGIEKTVVFLRPGSGRQTDEQAPLESESSPERFARIEPVRLEVHPEDGLFPHLTHLLGSVGALVGFSSVELGKLNVALLECCRIMREELKPEETFSIEIDSARPGVRVAIEIPRPDYDLYGKLRPGGEPMPLSEKAGRDWLLQHVDEVQALPRARATRYLLSLLD